jgi:hypothetical protein
VDDLIKGDSAIGSLIPFFCILHFFAEHIAIRDAINGKMLGYRGSQRHYAVLNIHRMTFRIELH